MKKTSQFLKIEQTASPSVSQEVRGMFLNHRLANAWLGNLAHGRTVLYYATLYNAMNTFLEFRTSRVC